jgi:hypothetical protein
MLRIETDEQLDRELLYILNQHIGKEQAIPRWDLVAKIYGPVMLHERNDKNPRDRAIRYSVSRLRAKGHLICDLGNGRGRYMAANESEFWEMYTSYVRPFASRAKVAQALKKAAESKWTLQMSLPDSSTEADNEEMELSL